MANIVCKSSNHEKKSLKMVAQTPEQLSIPFDKLPFDQKK